MSDVGLTVVDGAYLRAVDLTVPESGGAVTGAQVLELAESRASSSIFGLALPESLKSAALKRLNVDDAVSFCREEIDVDRASSILKSYVSAIAEQLEEDPLVIAVLDGKALRVFLDDEDDFAMLAENLFTDLDTKDIGKISKKEIRNALAHMGVELGIPPFSEFPFLNEILQKHGAVGNEELGQSQFAEVLQPIMQELADTLAEKPVVVTQSIKVVNGSKLRKLLASKEKLNAVLERILQLEKSAERTDIIRDFLEENAKELGLPSPKAGESVAFLYDAVFADVGNSESAAAGSEEEFRLFVKKILEKFAEQLEANPVFQDLDN
ncbi:uncharacterized protein LOC127801327 [Diospyros lotus]|uniref:uncharacterized protein LOC127801327 n=1 Tax=Diospyros lotus TaxID=55363 RepID=UPI002258B210|nr:uncharacterized protein LOC127801327 [Diospyros lotus]